MIESAVLAIKPAQPDSAVIGQAAEMLESGMIVVAPTETRYGLLARADDDRAIQRVFEAKGRQPLQPTALFVRDSTRLSVLGEMTRAATVVANRFLPGPLTLVLRSRKPWEPPRVVNGLIGIRWSSSPVIAELMAQVSFPVTATSANLTGSAELETIEQIQTALGSHVTLYLDGGPLNHPVSTVVKCVGDVVTILREGAISANTIHSLLKQQGLR